MQSRNENFNFHYKNLVTSNTDKFHVMIKVDSRTIKGLRLTHDNNDKNLVISNTDKFSVIIKGDSKTF